MKRLLRAVIAAHLLAVVLAAPATAGTDPTGDDDTGSTTPVAVSGASKAGGSFGTYGDQAISTYHITPFPWVAVGKAQDQRVQTRGNARKQADGSGFVMSEINLDTWEKGTNPATAECNADLVDPEVRSVKGDVRLRKWNSGTGWDNVRIWTGVTLCGGDHGHETLLGGDASVTIDAQAFEVLFESYDIEVAYGNDVQNHYTWSKRKSTGFSTWQYWCGGDNVITCDEDG